MAAWVLHGAVFWAGEARRIDAALSPTSARLSVPNAGRNLFLDNDSAYWAIHARDLIEQGRWRIRHTKADNAPDGRPVHWSQSVTWLMIGFGAIRQAATGQSLFEAVEDASVWINPVLLLALAWGLGRLLHRRWGAWAALLFAGLLCAQPDLEYCFQPLRPDHQSLLLSFVLASLVLAAFAGVAPSSPGERVRGRMLMALSGLLCGAAAWVGATVTLMAWVPALSVLALGFGVRRDGTGQSGVDPAAWRTWGVCATGASLLFFAVEYLPLQSSPVWEVNHPAYALSWLAWGEGMARLGGPRRRGARWMGALAVALALLPLLWVVVGPGGSHAMRDPMMLRFHREISEFSTLADLWSSRGIRDLALQYGALPLLPVFAAGRLWRRHRAGTAVAFDAALLFPALLFGGLSLIQIRWIPYAVMAGCVLAASLAGTVRIQGSGTRSPLRIAGLALLCLHPLLFAGPAVFRMAAHHRGQQIRPNLMRAALYKRVACNLAARPGGAGAAWMTEPDLAAALYYHARIPTVASYYWENIEGLRAWLGFFGDPGESEAHRIALERGITHVMVTRSPRLAMTVQGILEGAADRDRAGRTLAAGLVGSGRPIPSWLRLDGELTRIGTARYRLEGARWMTGAWETRLLVFRVEPDAGAE